jgi:hypothetical protein
VALRAIKAAVRFGGSVERYEALTIVKVGSHRRKQISKLRVCLPYGESGVVHAVPSRCETSQRPLNANAMRLGLEAK